MTRGPPSAHPYPNLPAHQRATQQLADDFNAAEQQWQKRHPKKRAQKARKRKAKRLIGFGAAP